MKIQENHLLATHFMEKSKTAEKKQKTNKVGRKDIKATKEKKLSQLTRLS